MSNSEEYEIDFQNIIKPVGNPPIDSEVHIKQFSLVYGFGPHENPDEVILPTWINIFDSRTDSEGNFFRNELFIVKNGSMDTLPNAYQFPNGKIRFFAFEYEVPTILSILNCSATIWMRTRNGKVSFIQGRKTLP